MLAPICFLCVIDMKHEEDRKSIVLVPAATPNLYHVYFIDNAYLIQFPLCLYLIDFHDVCIWFKFLNASYLI